MSAWWWVALVIVVTAPALIHWTAYPWAACRSCEGIGTLRDPWTRRWTGHCPDCAGSGEIERVARRAVRAATGGRVFPNPPGRAAPVLFGGQLPFTGGGRRPRRRRARGR